MLTRLSLALDRRSSARSRTATACALVLTLTLTLTLTLPLAPTLPLTLTLIPNQACAPLPPRRMWTAHAAGYALSTPPQAGGSHYGYT